MCVITARWAKNGCLINNGRHAVTWLISLKKKNEVGGEKMRGEARALVRARYGTVHECSTVSRDFKVIAFVAAEKD